MRLWPLGRADIFDLALEGKIATIESIEQDFEDRIYLAVIVDDDPGTTWAAAPARPPLLLRSGRGGAACSGRCSGNCVSEGPNAAKSAAGPRRIQVTTTEDPLFS